MNLEELGVALRAEREARGLSLDEVADRLKISARHVRALEEADEASLPHPAYAKGFLRAYAGLMGLAQGELDEALKSLSPQENITPTQTVYMASASRHSRLSGRLLSLLLALLVILGGLYALWSSGLLQRGMEMILGESSTVSQVARPAGLPETDRMEPEAEALPVVPVPSLSQAAPAPQAMSAPSSLMATAAAVAAEPDARPAMARDAAAETADAASPLAAENPQADAKAPAAAAAPALADGLHQVELIATGACWVQAHADKRPARQFSLNKGSSVTLTFEERLDLRLGNAGGVRILYDGEEQPSPGAAGQVRNLVFPPRS